MSDLPGDAGDGEDLDLGLPEATDDPELDAPLEPGEDDPPADPGEDDPQLETERTRRPTQSQRLRARAEQAERDNAEMRRRLEVIERGQQQTQQRPAVDPVAQQRAQAETRARREMMSPLELVEDVQREATQQFQQALLFERLNMQDQIDRRDFENAARSSKVHQRYRDEVERTLVATRNAGNLLATRGEILERLVGRDALARATGDAPRQRRAAAGRVAQHTVRPGAGRGDVPRGGGGRDQASADEALLRGLTAGDI